MISTDLGIIRYIQEKNALKMNRKNPNYFLAIANMNVGGLFGNAYYLYMENCYVTGMVAGEDYTGGLVGNCSELVCEYCYSSCSVNGETKSGGLAGYIDYYCHLTFSYSTGPISGLNYSSGLIGYSMRKTLFQIVIPAAQYLHYLGCLPD